MCCFLSVSLLRLPQLTPDCPGRERQWLWGAYWEASQRRRASSGTGEASSSAPCPAPAVLA